MTTAPPHRLPGEASPGPLPGRTLIIGCGRLGGDLGLALLGESSEVYGVRRDVTALPPGIRAIAADVDAGLPRELPDVDALVFTLPPSGAPRGYRRVLQSVHDSLPEIPRRTIFVSSTAVFAEWTGPQPITEAAEPRPMSDRARFLYDGEQAARSLFAATIVRPAGIYGPGRDHLVRTVEQRRPVDGDRITNRVHEVDLVAGLRAVLSAPSAPQTLHAVDGAPVALATVLSYISDALGVPPPPSEDTVGARGNQFDGTLFRSLLGTLTHPDFRSGYRAMLGERGTARPMPAPTSHSVTSHSTE